MSTKTIEDWKKAASKELKGKDPYESLMWHTQEVSCFCRLHEWFVSECHHDQVVGGTFHSLAPSLKIA